MSTRQTEGRLKQTTICFLGAEILMHIPALASVSRVRGDVIEGAFLEFCG